MVTYGLRCKYGANQNRQRIGPAEVNSHYNASARLWEKDKIGYVRINEQWLPFIEYLKTLYDNGKALETFITYINAGNGNYVNFNSDHIELYARASGSQNQGSFLLTTNKVDVTEYKTLFVDLSFHTTNNIYRIGFVPVRTTGGTGWTAFKQLSGALDERAIHSVDVSSLTGEYFFEAGAYSTTAQSGGIRILRIYKIWLEPLEEV